jgi:hypothetical protein
MSVHDSMMLLAGTESTAGPSTITVACPLQNGRTVEAQAILLLLTVFKRSQRTESEC